MMSTRIFIIAALLFLSSGCSLHQPVQVKLPVELPRQYHEVANNGSQLSPVDLWWETFADPQLNELVERLFKENLLIEQGFARLQQAQSSARVVRSARFPSIDGNAESGRSMQPTLVDDFTGNSSRFSVAARFELDLWGKLAARDRAAAKTAEASYEDLQTLYLSLTAQLADLYYLAVEQRAQLDLTDETIQSFTDTVELVEGRYRLGLVPALDVYQARQNLAAAKAARPVFAANLAAAEHAMNVLIGHYPERDNVGHLADLPEMTTAFPTGLPSTLVNRRPDLRAALRRVEAADENVASAIADRFPTINLLGTYGRTRQETTAGLLEGDFWSLLGSLAVPVVDAGRRKAEVDRRQAIVREAVAAYQVAVLQAFQEVEDALADSYANEQRIVLLAETQEATAGSLRLSLQNYLYGVNDYLPVLTSQRNNFEVRSRLLTARRQLISARISLARALGGQWMQTQIEQRLASTDGVPR